MANWDAATGGGDLAARCRTVYVDTSLDTHMVMVVGEADTVAEFKNKIKVEHLLCFSDIGEISINALQVKRRGFLYHLSDSMYVKNAFEGVKSKWFLYVDALRTVKHGLEICGPCPRANEILHCLENKDLVDGSDDPHNEPKNISQDFPKEVLFDGKDIGNVSDDLVRKVLSDLEVELEQTGDEHCRTSSDTNKRVTPKVYDSTFPDCQMENSHRKRKAGDSEKQVDEDMPNGDVLDEHGKVSNRGRKKHKIQKEKNSSKRSKTKTNSSKLGATDKGEQIDDTIHEQTNCADNNGVDMLCDSVLEGQEALNSVPSMDARQESEHEAYCDDLKKNQSHSFILNIGPTNEISNGAEAMHLEPVTEAVLPDLPQKGASKDSLMPEVPKVRKQRGGSDFTAAQLSDVQLEKSELIKKKMKKKKSKEKSLNNQLSSTALIPAEDSEKDNGKDTTGSKFAGTGGNSSSNYLGVENMEDALKDPQNFSTDQIHPAVENELLKESTEKLSLENQNPGDQRESDQVVEAHGILPNYGVVTRSKSSRKGRMTKKSSVETEVSNGVTHGILDDKSQIVVPTTNGGSCPDPSSEVLLADYSRHGVNEGSLKLGVTVNVDSAGRTDALDALPAACHVEVPFENSDSMKRKKKKNKACNQLSSTLQPPEKNSDGNIVNVTAIQSARVGKESGLKQLEVKEMEYVVQDHQNIATDQTTLVGDVPEPMSTEKVTSAEIETLVKASEVYHQDEAMVHLKSGKKAKKERKGSESGRKKKTKTVTEGEETTKEVLLNQNVENTASNLERTSITHLGQEETAELAEKATKRRSYSNDLSGPRAEASQLRASSKLENQVPTVEKDNQKSKMKSSTGHSNSRAVEADEGDLGSYRSADGVNQAVPGFNQDNGKAALVTEMVNSAANLLKVEGKHLGLIAGTTTSADDIAKPKKPSSTIDEINFIDYFVPSQHKSVAVASGDDVVVNEWITVKGKPDEVKLERKSNNSQDGKKYQVESSQESLSKIKSHGDVLHSDTESFRGSKNAAPMSSGTSSKQKLKSSHKRSKPCESNELEAAASHSPTASDALKSKLSRKEAKLNNNDSKSVPRHQMKENSKTFSATDSAFKSPVDRQPKKSKQLTTKKPSRAEAKKAKNGSGISKTLLSTNIFKDDNDESSDDDHGVSSGPSATTALDYMSASEVSEMEDNAGLETPQTVGQRRRAAEADNASRMNEYTLEMLREATLLEKAKRTAQMTQDSENQLDEFVPDSQVDQNP